MDTFDALQSLLSHELHELHQIQKRGWRILPMTRLVKEEHLGRCCYLAEEFLSTAELCALKKRLGLMNGNGALTKAKFQGSRRVSRAGSGHVV